MSSKLIFKQIREGERAGMFPYPGSTVTMETEADCLPDILEEFESFLRGCGYHFEGGLAITKEEDE